MKVDNTPWSKESEDTLRQLVFKGYPGTAIGQVLGKSRSAVLGKMYRLGIRMNPRIRMGSATVKKIRYPASKRKQAGYIPVQSRTCASTDGGPITPDLLKAHHCKWPFGDPKNPAFYFCGRARVDDKPYCAGHCEEAYRG